VGLLRHYFVRSVAPFLLGSLCSAACQRETASPPPEAPAATAEPSTTVPPRQEQAPSSDKSDNRTPRSVPPTAVPKQRSSPDRGERATRSFAVYTLSRAKGVPPEAREAQLKVQKLAEADRDRGLSVSIETTRIGIEGERRLCVAYQDPQHGARALARARVVVKGVDLINLVVEPCTTSAPKD
jgi:hypothetical protein